LVKVTLKTKQKDLSKKKVTKDLGIWGGTTPTPKGLTLDVPLDESSLFAFLQSGKYKSWKNQEKAIHPSAGPHESVRAFMKTF